MSLGPNRKRRAASYERNFGVRGDAVREMGCVTGWLEDDEGARACSGNVQAAHTTPRGMGGAHGSKRDLVGLCGPHHDEAGERGTSQRAAFDRLYGDGGGWLIREAVRIALELDELGLDLPADFELVHDAEGHGYEAVSQGIGLHELVTGWKTPQEASSAAWERWRELTGWPGST